MKKCFIFILLALIANQYLSAQTGLTIADFTEKQQFRSQRLSNVNWMKEGSFYTALVKGNIIKFDIVTGQQIAIFYDASEHENIDRIDRYSLSSDEKTILIATNLKSIYRRSFIAEYYIYDINKKTLSPLSTNGLQSYATFSPDGKKVAFVRDNDLFYVDLASGKENRVTLTGKKGAIINGSTDWVYEEELSLTKAFFWSPNSDQLAFYTFDERNVNVYNLQLWTNDKLYPQDYQFKYPKAGEKNAAVSCHIYSLANKQSIPVFLGDNKDIYIPRIQWTKTPNVLSIIRLNRLQNKMEILHVDSKTGKGKLILKQEYSTYVDIDEADFLAYLNDKKHFILSDESSGFRHLHLYDMDGKLVRKITSGAWEVKSIIGIEQSNKNSTIYYTSTEQSPLERHVYSIQTNGKNKRRLTSKPGTYTFKMSADFKFYIQQFHSNDVPLEIGLYKTKNNSLIKTLVQNDQLLKNWQTYGLSKKEFFKVKTADSVSLNGYMLKPSSFDASRKYPVLIYQYSGPGSQNVTNAMGAGQNYYWHQFLCQKGYIIVVVDPRGTGSRGVNFQKMTYKQLGKYESEDMITTAKYLSNLNYIDNERIGIWGWSYGGYISSLTMFQAQGLFKAAIAVAPVTNWRFYDTIYTERYLGLPEDNPSGYDDNSPLQHAAKLNGNFLLIHGTGDDNVHMQNSVHLQNALIAAGKQFSAFYYPDRAHGINAGKGTKTHLYQMMTDFILENL